MKILIKLGETQWGTIFSLVKTLCENISAKDRRPNDKFERAENAVGIIACGVAVDVEDLNGLLDTIGGAFSAACKGVELGITTKEGLEDFKDAMDVAIQIEKQMRAQGALAIVTKG